MKKLLFIFSILLPALFVSCSDDNEGDTLEKGKAKIHVNCWDKIYKDEGFIAEGMAYFFKVSQEQTSIQYTVGSNYIILEDGTKITSSFEGKTINDRTEFIVDAPANYIVVFVPLIYSGYTFGYKEVRENDSDPWIRLSFSDKNR